MNDLGLLIVKVISNMSKTYQIWNPNETQSKVIYQTCYNPNLHIGENNRAVFFSSQGGLYVGTKDEGIQMINPRDGTILNRYGKRKTFFSDGKWEDQNIKQFVEFEGEVYDVGLGGLFNTKTGEKIDDRRLQSAEVKDGQLLIVPSGLNRNCMVGKEISEAQGGHLINAITKEIVMEDVRPYDGAGNTQGEHRIVNNKVYMHHGNYPGEKITIRKYPSGEQISRTGIWSTGMFKDHDGIMYDARLVTPNAQDNKGNYYSLQAITQSNITLDGVNESALPDICKYVLPAQSYVKGMVSSKDYGLLVGVYDSIKNDTQIISLDDPSDPLLKIEGNAYIRSLD